MAPPIWQVADYGYDSAQHYSDVINERRPGQIYGRYGGPTVQTLGQVLASLEGGEAAWVFSSGMGAIHSVLMHLAGVGDHIVAARTVYGGTYGLFTIGAPRAGIEVTFADATDSASVQEALRPNTRGVFVESIANPTLEVCDLEGIGSLCAQAQIPLVVDNTVATPALLNPLRFGASLVVHATSKFIGGHHDLMGGAVIGPQDRVDEIRHLAIRYGSTSSGFESWLALRGLATLGLRVERHCSNALAVAMFLEAQPSVERVLYPGLASHPQHERASKFLTGYTGMVAVDLGSQEGAWRFMDSTRVARVGSSFGGVRSELTHPASTSHRQFSNEDRQAAGITDGLVRIAVGLENVDDLLADFEGALR